MEIRRRPPNPKVKVAHLEYAIPHEEGEPRHILEQIVWEKDREVASARERLPLDKLKSQVAKLPAPRDFLAALRARARAEQTDEGTSLATALAHVARRGGRAQWWVSTPQTGEEERERLPLLVAEVVSTRRRAWERLERAGRRVTLPGPVGLFSDLPDEDLGEGDLAETAAPLRLEAHFGKWH